jgi:hypothetical protein
VRSAAFRKSAFSFQFAEGHFNWVQVGRIGRQIEYMRTYRFNRFPDAGNFMHRQIVHENELAALERRGKVLLYITDKHRSVHWAINHTRCGHSVLAQARHESDGLAISFRCIADQTLASRTASSLPYGDTWRSPDAPPRTSTWLRPRRPDGTIGGPGAEWETTSSSP